MIQRIATVAAAFVLSLAAATAQAQVVQSPEAAQAFSSGIVYTFAKQADGKVLVGGDFKYLHGVARSGLARLNADGSLDSTWNPALGPIGTAPPHVRALAIDASGNVYVGGGFVISRTAPALPLQNLAKLLPSGALDSTWEPNVGTTGSVRALALDGSGSLFVGGSFATTSPFTRNNLMKVSTAGSGAVDAPWDPLMPATSNTAVETLALDGNGNLFVGGLFTSIGGLARQNVAKLSAIGTGAADPTWLPQANATVRTLVVDGSGSIYVGGDFTTIASPARRNIARLSTTGTGSADATWNPNPTGASFTSVFGIALSGGDVYVGGFFDNIGGSAHKNAAKLTAAGTGTADALWTASPASLVLAVALGGGGFIIGGDFSYVDSSQPRLVNGGLALLNLVTGVPVSSWPLVLRDASVFAIARDASGRTLIGGSFIALGDKTTRRTNLARFNADGTPDSQWAPNPNSFVGALAVDATGDVFVGGGFTSIGGETRFGVAKVSDLGVVDATWNPGTGAVNAMALDGGGNLYVAGSFSQMGGQARAGFARVATGGAGSADAIWNPVVTGNVMALALDPGGSIFAAGTFTTAGGLNRRGLAKISTSGTGVTDAGWDASLAHSSASPFGSALALDGSGNLYVGGAFTSIGGVARNRVARVATAGIGVVDATWDPNVGGPLDSVRSLALDGSGNVFVGGFFTGAGGLGSKVNLVKVSTAGSGTVDAPWNPNPSASVRAIRFVSATALHVAGDFTAIGGASRAGYVVLTTTSVPGAPTIGAATAGNGQATVAFTAPSSNGGLAITSYTATSSPGGITASGTSSPITVTGLTNGTAYTFTVKANNAFGPGDASAASNSVTPTAAARLFAISTRANVLTGDDVMIGGFIIQGAVPKSVVVRARGPSLGVAGNLADPTLTLVPAAGGPTLTNDDWGLAANAAALQASGFAPGNAKEAAILVTLNPGAYTAIVSGVGNTTGVAIVEVYEMDHPEVPAIAISTRARAQTGDNVVIGGFIIQGASPLQVVVRARGPSLGLTSALADPTLTIVPAAGGQNLVNDDWGLAPNAANLQASGYAPGNVKEAAILVTLAPGAYTAIVSGVGNTTGVAIVEVYVVP